MERNCASCAAWNPPRTVPHYAAGKGGIPEDATTTIPGTCRRFAPRVAMAIGPSDDLEYETFASTDADDWCLDWVEHWGDASAPQSSGRNA